MTAMSDARLPSSQRGAALMVVLVLLLIMTLLGLSSLRGSLMGQRMSANTYDRNVSLQAAEAGLREAEASLTTDAFPSNGCSGGLCAQPTAAVGTPDRWADSTIAWKTATAVADDNMTPQYLIEQMGTAPNWAGCDQEVPMHPDCLTPRYRLTARNFDPTTGGDRALVVLQSNYAAALPSP